MVFIAVKPQKHPDFTAIKLVKIINTNKSWQHLQKAADMQKKLAENTQKLLFFTQILPILFTFLVVKIVYKLPILVQHC